MSYADAVRWLVLLAFSILPITAEVFSCGGFVKSPNVPLDYSKVQVKLFTAEGNLKFETECSPTNGYYMIPVYNKGDYAIRLFAPDGWFFEPSTFDLKVDGKTDLCTKGEDINFVLAAFAVEGVLRSGDGDGPAGVALTLSGENGSVIAETKTVANGLYRFRAPPGKYLVSTASDSTECIELGKVSVAVTTSPVRVAPDLKISGHLLTVVVLSKKIHVAGVSIALHSDAAIKLPYCEDKSASSDQDELKEMLVCKLKTDNKGIVRFPCVPPGTYIICPSFSTDKVRFSFSPKTKKIRMGSAAEKVIFDTLGFSSKGRVLLSGKPVSDATVYVNGEPKGKTDEDGWYTLDGLQDEDYTITARKKHFAFNTVNVRLSTKKAEIPNIVVESVEVCVLVDVEESSSHVISIVFTSKQTRIAKTVSTDSDGKVCTLLPAGEYFVWVSSSNDVIMTPKQREIDTSDGPVVDVFFSQFRADVNVNVICIDDCGKLKMELWRQKELIKTMDGTNHFTFHEISPDSYKLKIVDDNRFCWENTDLDIVIERANLNNLIFRQTGYWTTTRLSHPAKAKWSMLEKPQVSGSLDVPAGQFSFCTPLAGIYTITFDACHKFDKQSYEITIPQEVPLLATATKFMITASVELNAENASHEDLALYIKSHSEERTVHVASSSSNRLLFTSYLSSADTVAPVTLVPQSKTYLFIPTSHVFHFSGECHLDEVTFKADKGVFLDGQILPAIEGVIIRSSHRIDPNVFFETVTDANGRYRMGPLRSVEDFDIVAEKSGYKFESAGKFGSLRAIKLSQLIIIATDIETGEPLSSVLISLSGVENYRSNNFIDETGKISYVGLRPGEYFLRPILQEYQFDPKFLTVNINEGEFETVNLKGRRFAYSVFGKVSHPAGQPVPSVVVEAVSEHCSQLQEEDITNENGDYRVRGLHPKCFYRLVLKTSEGQRMQSYPAHYDIMVNGEDVKDIDFVLAQISEQVDVAGEVIFVDTKSPSQYKIGLYKGDNLVQQITVNAPSTVFYFDIAAVDNSEYSIRFETVHGIGNQKLDSAEVFFTANETFKAVSLSVRPQRKSEVEISGGSYFALPFFFIVAYLFFNHQKAVALVETTFVRLSNISLPQRSPSPNEDYVDAVRKRQKLKKPQ